MNIKPKFGELVLASRFTLPLWLGFGLWFWSSGEAALYWQRLDESGRAEVVFIFSVIVAGMVTAFPKVWAYEQAGGSVRAVRAIYSRLRVSLQKRLRGSLGREPKAFDVPQSLHIPKRGTGNC